MKLFGLLLVFATGSSALDANGCPDAVMVDGAMQPYSLGTDGNCYRRKPALNYVRNCIWDDSFTLRDAISLTGLT